MAKMDFLVNTVLSIEKLRVAAQVRRTHLALRERQDEDTDQLCKRLAWLEKFVDGKIAKLVERHPAYPWFSQVKGVGKENIAKVIGLIRVKPEKNKDGADLPYADTVSALWKFAGYAVEDGKAPKRVRGGGKLSYNSRLRSMCWRLGGSLLKARGRFYDYYLRQKDRLVQKYGNEGISIVPASALPKKDGKRYEPEGVITEGHVHNRALRKMIKLFLACLWLVWREAEGLPATDPYPIDRLGHGSFIAPWEMTDKKATANEAPIRRERAILEEEPCVIKRANEAEEPMAAERAKITEEPISKERARGVEEPNIPERANQREEPMAAERAILEEEPCVIKRANDDEEPIGGERPKTKRGAR